MKNMFIDMVNILIQAEVDESIEYNKYDRKSSANTTNSRNRYNSKQVNTSLGKVSSRAVYVVLGIDLEGKKDILSIVIGENESSKFWLKVVDELRTRGI